MGCQPTEQRKHPVEVFHRFLIVPLLIIAQSDICAEPRIELVTLVETLKYEQRLMVFAVLEVFQRLTQLLSVGLRLLCRSTNGEHHQQ